MAVINIEGQEVQPKNYLGLSQGTDRAMQAGTITPSTPRSQGGVEYKADTSKGVALNAVAQGITGAVNTVDTLYKTVAKQRTEEGLRAITDEWTRDLNTAVGASPLEGAVATAETTQNTDIPPGLKTYARGAATLKNARLQGKLAEGDYIQRAEAYTRQMINAFPGYEDFIRNVSSNVLGFKSDTALWKSRLSALQQMAAEGKDKQDKITRMIETHGQYMDEYMADGLAKGTFTPTEAALNIAHNQRIKQNRENELQILRLNEARGQADAKQYEKNGVGISDEIYTNATSNLINAGGPATAAATLDAVLKGENPPSEAIKQGLVLVNQQKAIAIRRLQVELNAPQGDGPSIAQRLGTDKTADIVRKFIDRWDVEWVKPFTTGDIAALNLNKISHDIKKDYVASEIDKSDVGPGSIALEVIRERMGPNAASIAFDKIAAQVQTTVIPHVEKILKRQYDGWADMSKRNKQAFQGSDPEREAKTFEEAIKNPIKWIQNPDIPEEARTDFVRFTFSAQNHSVMEDLKKKKPEAYRELYDAMTSPRMQSAILQLRDKNPETWFTFKKFAYDQFNVRLKDELSSINNAIEQGAPIILDPSTNRLGLDKTVVQPTQNKGEATAQQERIKQVGNLQQPTISKINSELDKLNILINEDNPDVDVKNLLTKGIPSLSMIRKVPGVKLGSNGKYYVTGPDGLFYEVQHG